MIEKILVSGWPMIVVFIFDNVIANPVGWYDRWWWFDIPMHIVGGMVTAWSTQRFFMNMKIKLAKFGRMEMYPFILVGATAIIGIVWEVYEFFLHLITGFITQPSVADTVGDLVNDLIGAIVFCSIFLVVQQKKKKYDT